MKSFFRKRTEAKENKILESMRSSTIKPTEYDNSVHCSTDVLQLMANDGVNICAEACACCWDTKLPSGYEDRIEYIRKRTVIGHGSVTEHSNHVYYLEIPDDRLVELSEFLSIAHYVHTIYKHSKQYAMGYLIVGGSWRAFRDLFIKMDSYADNYVMRFLLNAIYDTQPSCGYSDLIKAERIHDQFVDAVQDYRGGYQAKKGASPDGEIEIVSCDNFDVLLEGIKRCCPEPYLFSPMDLLDMVTCTVLYKGMSRIITQQLTRHRNAITQESQRYVNYSKGVFNSPAKFKEKYDPDFKYPIQFGKSSHHMNLQELGDAIAAIYGQLQDPQRTQGHILQNEDARAYLPNNIQCGKIYITFTWRSLLAYFGLRCDNHAQVEMRLFAEKICAWWTENFTSWKEYSVANTIRPYANPNEMQAYNIYTARMIGYTEEDSDKPKAVANTPEEVIGIVEEQVINTPQEAPIDSQNDGGNPT